MLVPSSVLNPFIRSTVWTSDKQLQWNINLAVMCQRCSQDAFPPCCLPLDLNHLAQRLTSLHNWTCSHRGTSWQLFQYPKENHRRCVSWKPFYCFLFILLPSSVIHRLVEADQQREGGITNWACLPFYWWSYSQLKKKKACKLDLSTETTMKETKIPFFMLIT